MNLKDLTENYAFSIKKDSVNMILTFNSETSILNYEQFDSLIDGLNKLNNTLKFYNNGIKK